MENRIERATSFIKEVTYASIAADNLSEAKADVRDLNIELLKERKAKILDKIGPKLGLLAGATAGGALGVAGSKLFTKKQRARIYYLEQKGTTANSQERQELRKLKQGLTNKKIVGGVIGATAGAGLANLANKKIAKAERKIIWNTGN